MATTNGTLKYKQDDGSIVELNPVGVDARARNLAISAGQIANNAQDTANTAKDTANTALARIGNWQYEDTVVTRLEDLHKADIALDTRVKKLEIPSTGIYCGFMGYIGPQATITNFTVIIPIPAYIELLLANNVDVEVSISGGTGGTYIEVVTESLGYMKVTVNTIRFKGRNIEISCTRDAGAAIHSGYIVASRDGGVVDTTLLHFAI